jgi:hypothetical protein
MAEHTGGVPSKYDAYWASRLAEIRAAVERATRGLPASVGLAGLGDIGERQSWYGAVDVRARDVTRSSMAHAKALGQRIAADGLCASWPQSTFRFTISAAGDVLTINAVGSRDPRRIWPAMPRAKAPAENAATLTARAKAGRSAVPYDAAVESFYLALRELAEVVHGPRRLRDSHRADGWPRQGVYFFYEPGEVRADRSGRIVRVGTHALTATSQATLWGRLRQHRGHVGGSHPGGGNHRASVFRRHVGAALVRREKLPRELLDSWLDRHGPRPGFTDQEAYIEQEVSRHIGAMPFLWLSVPDRADRGYVERNSIALTSCLAAGIDPSSTSWLGRYAYRTEICDSGLWNVDHVRHDCDTGFLDLLSQLIKCQR